MLFRSISFCFMLIICMSVQSATTIQFTGLVEVDVGSVRDDQGKVTENESTLTAEIAMHALINPLTKAHIQILHEDDETELDEGKITLGRKNGIYAIDAGLRYLSFGTYDTQMISDPLTLELGETRQSSIEGSLNLGDFTISAYLYSGDVDESDGVDKHMNHLGFNAGFQKTFGKINFEASIGYIDSVDNAGLATEVLPEIIQSHVSAVGYHAKLHSNNFAIVLESIESKDQYQVDELAFNGEGAMPSANHIEIAYIVPVQGRDLVFAAASQKTKEAEAMGLPETRNMFSIGYNVAAETTLKLEYFTDDDYAGVSTSTYTFQIATAF